MEQTPRDEALGRSAHEVLRALRNGDELLLVCAYDSPVSLAKFPLPGALDLAGLREGEAQLGRDSELVFYCWCPQDKTSKERAREWRARGFRRANFLLGGVDAWRSAGARLAR